MSIRECINHYKQKSKHSSIRISSIWICPSVAIKPRIGVNYTVELATNAAVPDVLADLQVTKHWMENNKLCIIYKNTEEIQTKLYK